MASHEDYATLSNGEVVNVWSYGVPNDNEGDFKTTPFDTSLEQYKHYMHAAHGMIYSLSDDVLWKKYKRYGNVLMQMRCDGNLGFGGGLLDLKEDVVQCLNREMNEEFGVEEKNCKFEQSDHISTSVNDKKRFVAHFYAKQLTNEALETIEKGVIQADDWGAETMGITRVPLFLMDDGMRGLPLFLANRFAGFAKEQLIETLKQRKIIPEHHLQNVLDAYRKYMSST